MARKDRVYIVLTHSYIPKKGERDQWEVSERCEFVDKIKSRHNDSATLILDYIDRKIVKDRVGQKDYNDYMYYIEENYADQLKELEKVYERKTNTD